MRRLVRIIAYLKDQSNHLSDGHRWSGSRFWEVTMESKQRNTRIVLKIIEDVIKIISGSIKTKTRGLISNAKINSNGNFEIP